jgi:methane/ammonia monooxygenase subunit C
MKRNNIFLLVSEVELGAETPAKNPYVAEMYKLALEGKLYSRAIP